MDGRDFDNLLRSLTESRRTVLGGLLAGCIGILGQTDARAKKKKKRNKKRKKNQNQDQDQNPDQNNDVEVACNGAQSFNGCCRNGVRMPGTEIRHCGGGGGFCKDCLTDLYYTPLFCEEQQCCSDLRGRCGNGVVCCPGSQCHPGRQECCAGLGETCFDQRDCCFEGQVCATDGPSVLKCCKPDGSVCQSDDECCNLACITRTDGARTCGQLISCEPPHVTCGTQCCGEGMTCHPVHGGCDIEG